MFYFIFMTILQYFRNLIISVQMFGIKYGLILLIGKIGIAKSTNVKLKVPIQGLAQSS